MQSEFKTTKDPANTQSKWEGLCSSIEKLMGCGYSTIPLPEPLCLNSLRAPCDRVRVVSRKSGATRQMLRCIIYRSTNHHLQDHIGPTLHHLQDYTASLQDHTALFTKLRCTIYTITLHHLQDCAALHYYLTVASCFAVYCFPGQLLAQPSHLRELCMCSVFVSTWPVIVAPYSAHGDFLSHFNSILSCFSCVDRLPGIVCHCNHVWLCAKHIC